MITIEVMFFGGLRKYGSFHQLEFEQEQQLPLMEFKKKILEFLVKTHTEFNDEKLVLDSAVSNEEEIFQDQIQLKGKMKVALLPPVCGG